MNANVQNFMVYFRNFQPVDDLIVWYFVRNVNGDLRAVIDVHIYWNISKYITICLSYQVKGMVYWHIIQHIKSCYIIPDNACHWRSTNSRGITQARLKVIDRANRVSRDCELIHCCLVYTVEITLVIVVLDKYKIG